MQNITIVGRLGRDAVLRESTSGQRFLSFTVAVNSKIRGAEKTTWYEVISFQEQHLTKLKDYLTVGSVVIVTGELDVTLQVGKDGVSRVRTSINADRVDFTPSSQSGATTNTSVKVENTTAEEVPEDIPMVKEEKKKSVKKEEPKEEVPEVEDDLPF